MAILKDNYSKFVSCAEKLNTHEALMHVDHAFIQFLKRESQELSTKIQQQREHKHYLNQQDIIDISIHLETFLVDFFDIKSKYHELQSNWNELSVLRYLYQHVQKGVRHQFGRLDHTVEKPKDKVLQKFLDDTDAAELALANYAQSHPEDSERIQAVLLWAKQQGFKWLCLRFPEKRDPMTSVDYEVDDKKQMIGKPEIHRDGFDHNLSYISAREAFHESQYCIYCHKSNTDFCRQGFPVKKGLPEIKKDVHEVDLTGCPLDEKISEMNWLQQVGHPLAAFAVILCDNPMAPATGHRICNDCIKACVYQKQTPVDVPKIESHVLKEVLSLSWGVEIYNLLVKWNPLRIRQWVQQPDRSESVLVMGMGPAGFTMAHHLRMEGFQVVGMDGMAMSLLPKKWIDKPIENYQSIYEAGEKRPFRGFGGVSEYGITARWDKNFLKLIQLSLLRRNVHLLGGVRFGGTINFDDAWSWGFNHFTIAVGAGLPKALDIPNSMATGMRQANDFLMSLHLGAYHHSSELEIRLPAVVIGSGLTAVDTATELQAYYIRQVTRCYDYYQMLKEKNQINSVKQSLSAKQWAALMTFVEHGSQIKQCRIEAQKKNSDPNFAPLIRSWGGVTIIYRRSLVESPAYRLNHEEVDFAFKQGVQYLEYTTPKKVLLDEDEHVCGIEVTDQNGDPQILEAGAILAATGAYPNIAYGFEHRDVLEKNGRYYQGFYWKNHQLIKADSGLHCKDKPIAPLTNYNQDGHRVSFIGDGQPAFHGSVVKAIASAAQAYTQIVDVIDDEKPSGHLDLNKLHADFKQVLISEKKIGQWYQTVIKAPLIARKWRPGHFVRMEFDDCNEPLTVYPYAADESCIYIYGLHPIEGKSFKLMGPSGVHLFEPKEKGAILLYIDEEGVGAGYSFAKSLIEKHHEVTILTNQASFPILKEIPGVQLETSSRQLLKHHYSHVWVLAKPEGVEVIQSMKKDGYFMDTTDFVAATYGPMQCMLKGVCAQCLQWQIDPMTHRRTKAVYACSWQHQPMDIVAWDHAQQRRKVNPVLKTMSQMWLNYPKET